MAQGAAISWLGGWGAAGPTIGLLPCLSASCRLAPGARAQTSGATLLRTLAVSRDGTCTGRCPHGQGRKAARGQHDLVRAQCAQGGDDPPRASLRCLDRWALQHPLSVKLFRCASATEGLRHCSGLARRAPTPPLGIAIRKLHDSHRRHLRRYVYAADRPSRSAAARTATTTTATTTAVTPTQWVRVLASSLHVH